MDAEIETVLDVLAPYREVGDKWSRYPIFEWPHETTPTSDEMTALAREMVEKLRATRRP